MKQTHSFIFADSELHRRLIALFKKSHIAHEIDRNGAVHYSPDDEEAVEDKLLASIRSKVFPSWQVLSCPRDWAERYRQYLRGHDIPFVEELSDGELCFLIPRKYRPHSWKLGEAAQSRRRAAI